MLSDNFIATNLLKCASIQMMETDNKINELRKILNPISLSKSLTCGINSDKLAKEVAVPTTLLNVLGLYKDDILFFE